VIAEAEQPSAVTQEDETDPAGERDERDRTDPAGDRDERGAVVEVEDEHRQTD